MLIPGMFISAGRSCPDRPVVGATMLPSGCIGLRGPEILWPVIPEVLQLRFPLAFLSGPSREPRTSKGDM
ncbi:hypothetical protein MUK42_36387 [Musa troglodytarum]|uniref:Uncharacterized protein n=1 Tax=Musa troglodytarum TaxID=320322 RepID=A0A9E7EAC7_9LILI|nr:hypothetical protein MUK42_36387 [Musa troglodytarum]